MKGLFSFFFCLLSVIGKTQIIADTFYSNIANGGNSTPIFSNTVPIPLYERKTLSRYRASEISNKGIVPGVIIYGISYHKPLNGHLLSTATASFEIRLRSGIADTSIPFYSGLGITCYDFTNTYMTGGFSSWTIFTNGSNLNIPDSPGWLPPMMVDVPFVYTGGALDITTDMNQTANAFSGFIGLSSEVPINSSSYSYLYFISNGYSNDPYSWYGLNNHHYRPATIIYHSSAPPPCSGMPNGGAVTGLADVCKNADFTLYLNNPSAGPGISYQWQKSTVTPVSWVNISGATGPTYTTSTLMPMMYRCKVTCNNTTQSAFSSGFTVTPHQLQLDSVAVSVAGNVPTILPFYSDTAIYNIFGYAIALNTGDTIISGNAITKDGTYNLMVTHYNNCNADTVYKTFTIGCQGSPSFYDSIAKYPNTTCANQPITLQLADTLPSNYTVQWSYFSWTSGWVTLTQSTGASITLTSPSNGTVIMNKATCSISGNYKYSNYDTVWITPPPTAGTIQALNTTGNNYNFTNSGMTNAQSYKWYFGDGDSSTSLAPSHHYNVAGTYTAAFVAKNSGNSCIDTAFTTVHITTGIDATQPKLFSISPNPFNESFVVSCPAAKGFITITDEVGKTLVRLSLSKPTHTIDMKGFTSGIYLIKFQNGNETSTQKIIKQ